MVLPCFSSVLPLLRVLSRSAKGSVISWVPQPVQKAPLNWIMRSGGVREMSLADGVGAMGAVVERNGTFDERFQIKIRRQHS